MAKKDVQVKRVIGIRRRAALDRGLAFRTVTNRTGSVWEKLTYNRDDKVIRIDDSDGNWCTYEYDDHGRTIGYLDSDGHWYSKAFGPTGVLVFFEDGYGVHNDERPERLVTNMSLSDAAKIIGIHVRYMSSDD